MSDELAIRALIGRSAYLGDSGAPDSYREIYTTDAVWEFGDQRQDGIEEIVAATTERRKEGVSGPGTASRHVVIPMHVDIDGDEAVAHSYLQFFRNTDAAPTLAMLAVYEDTLHRTDGTWRISRRSVNLDQRN